MNPPLLLRIASILALFHAVAHTVGGVFGAPEPGPQQAAVLAMKSNHFYVMGNTRTFWDFYFGFGMGISIFLFAEAVVLWQLATLAKTDAARVRPVFATFSVAYVVFAINSFQFFFYPPVVVELLIALCLGLAFFSSAGPGHLPTVDRLRGRVRGAPRAPLLPPACSGR